MGGETILLFGGPSREWLVSVATAQNLAAVLHNPLCWFWSPSGAVHEIGAAELSAHQLPFEREFSPSTPPLAAGIDEALDSRGSGDVVVLGLHGAAGEDGTIQRRLEARRIPFTGSGSKASELAFNKAAAKEALRRKSVPVAESLVAGGGSSAPDRGRIESLLKSSGKLVLKPVSEGSSYGLHFAASVPEVEKILAAESGEYLIEPFIAGTELTCGVAEMNGRLVALPSVEIRIQAGRSFDYAGKYLGAGSEEICPAEVSADVETAVRQLALQCHSGLGCFGYSRTDFIHGGEGPVFLETNTLPGLTRTSLIPKELDAAGISMRDFMNEQIGLARGRYAA